ncbi:MAG: phospho-N-acetylmuramoyl-pentapeptide-transferase [Firmicutes bacterium]|jgi:phospho-N-acetylmuramoyl-pentapeptide-transferase|nr:phospho-N-acetylmuramoyl-pentapeptide-transferase [Bacillota bacterium]
MLCAAIISLTSSLLVAPVIIAYLRRLKYGQVVRSDGPASHLKKSGTPSMGGVIIILATLVGSVSASPGFQTLPWALFLMTSFGLVGMLDDYISIVARRSLGLRARQKLLFQLLLGAILGVYAYLEPSLGPTVAVPFTGGIRLDLGFWYIPFAAIVVTGASNGVNLTDGLDGLAAGASAVAAFAYSVIASSLGSWEMCAFAGALGGACLGFVWWNVYPAQVFMGDTGSLALGAALGSLAILTKTELVLFIVGGVFVAETLSVAAQVISFKLTGRRVLRMAPLHHHFELTGLAETQIVVRFWIVAGVFAAIGFMGL